MNSYLQNWHNPVELKISELLDPAQVVALGNPLCKLYMDPFIEERVISSRKRLLDVIHRGETHYGINTGVGDLARVPLKDKQSSKLSENLIRSHACGWGQGLGRVPSRAILVCAINQWCHGHSGISPEIIKRFLMLFNLDIDPWMPMGGSLDYSLVPMAHAGLLLLGRGKAYAGNRLIQGSRILKKLGIPPIKLGPKDGLAMISGTAAPLGLSCLAWQKCRETLRFAQWISSLSFEALGGDPQSFHPAVHEIRKHPGQSRCAGELRQLLQGSQLLRRGESKHVQDCTSLRALPQVHGACDDILLQTRTTLGRELQSSTDNPQLVTVEGRDELISSYNPSCQALAFSLEQMAHVLVELCNLSERRVDRLLTPRFSNLPAFLSPNPGINSGMMIPHYACAGTLARLRLLATPLVVQNFVTTGGQEDHTSLATASAARILEMIPEVLRIFSIELLCASQAIHLIDNGVNHLSDANRALYARLRQVSPALRDDRELHHDLDQAFDLLNQRQLLAQGMEFGLLDCFDFGSVSMGSSD